MTQKRVVIVSSQGLFRDGLRRMLASVAQVEAVSSRREAEDLARASTVDVIIVDQEDDQLAGDEVVARWPALPGMRVIVVSLEAGDLQIYQREQVVGASPEALVAAVTGQTR